MIIVWTNGCKACSTSRKEEICKDPPPSDVKEYLTPRKDSDHTTRSNSPTLRPQQANGDRTHLCVISPSFPHHPRPYYHLWPVLFLLPLSLRNITKCTLQPSARISLHCIAHVHATTSSSHVISFLQRRGTGYHARIVVCGFGRAWTGKEGCYHVQAGERL
jgi:hypothetical protein